MSEWKEYKFSDFVNINPPVRLLKGEQYSFVEMKDLTDGQRHCYPNTERELSGGARFNEGDTLFARITPCLENGKISQVKGLKNGSGFGSTEFFIFRGKDGVSDNDFVYYLSRWDEVRAFAEMNFDGTSGRQRVPKDAFNNLFLNLPPLPEQKSIASILSSLDDKIDLLHRQNKTLEALAETLFRQWFVEEAEEGWETKAIEDLIIFDPREKVSSNIEYTLFDMKCLSDSSMAISEGIKRTVNSGSSFRNGDTLLAKITPCLENGKTGFVMNLEEDELARGSTEFVVMRAKEGTSPYFVYCLTRYSDFRNTAILSMTGTSGRQRVQTVVLKGYEIKYSKKAMDRFHSTCHPHFIKIRQNQIQIRTLTSLRDTLLPKLISGEVRVRKIKMTIEKIISVQKNERKKCLDAILSSKSSKKIILAGAGTGKTFTFKEVLNANPEGENIAMTFIRMLTSDMYASFGDLAEVKTFHAYCKKILHEQNGKVELIPFLTKIIEEDAQILELELKDFDRKIQMLDEGSPEVAFYLRRGDYYDAVSFNDSVYRLYKALQEKPDIVPNFNQILIDEYQDFNPLEVAFINELEEKGNILIVGDDDQAVYAGRCASPNYLRDKFNSGDYEKFELPFCSRCPEVIVNATNAFLSNAQGKGFLKGRVNKRYECFIELKGNDSTRFSKIITAQCSTGNTVAKYVDNIIQKIDASDIEESWKEGSEYPTVLIVGPKQYLAIIQKELSGKYPQMVYKLNEEKPISMIEGYDILLRNDSSNLGWRILITFYFKSKEIKTFIEESERGKQMLDILDKEFIQKHKRVIEIISIIKSDEGFTEELKDELKEIVKDFYDEIIECYSPKEKEEEEKPDKTKPSILLSSFVGCKGLSAGYVMIVGANDSSIPKDPNNISDVEIAQFMVALTRTRKQCHIISNQWHIAPISKKGCYQKPYEKSVFLNWIPSQFIEDKGVLKSGDIK